MFRVAGAWVNIDFSNLEPEILMFVNIIFAAGVNSDFQWQTYKPTKPQGNVFLINRPE
jgi:hypothetical protein